MSEEQTINVQPKKDKIKTAIIFVVLLLSLGMNIFLLLKDSTITGDSISQTSFKYISPLSDLPINSNYQEPELIIHYQGLKEILENDIKNIANEQDIGIFIQDIKTGSWLGINERNGFTPASLLKIPIMMAILKKVQREEIKLDEKVTILPQDLNSDSGNLYERGAGAEFSISELLEAMIATSDNTATNALKRQLSLTEIDYVFVHVGVPNPYLSTNEQVVSPRGYSRIFKSLYFSTYLPPELSEFALDLATDGLEESLISKGIPPEIQVAHKFGIKNSILHDCGIVYHPSNPYFICVMTKDLEQARDQELIVEISKDVYDFVDKK